MCHFFFYHSVISSDTMLYIDVTRTHALLRIKNTSLLVVRHYTSTCNYVLTSYNLNYGNTHNTLHSSLYFFLLLYSLLDTLLLHYPTLLTALLHFCLDLQPHLAVLCTMTIKFNLNLNMNYRSHISSLQNTRTVDLFSFSNCH